MISQRVFDQSAVIYGPQLHCRAALQLASFPGCSAARESEGSNTQCCRMKSEIHLLLDIWLQLGSPRPFLSSSLSATVQHHLSMYNCNNLWFNLFPPAAHYLYMASISSTLSTFTIWTQYHSDLHFIFCFFLFFVSLTYFKFYYPYFHPVFFTQKG